METNLREYKKHFSKIKVLQLDGSNVMAPDGWPLVFDNYSKGYQWQNDNYTAVFDLMNEVPIYYRGKLKGDIQISKDGTTLIISHSYYNKILANEGAISIISYKSYVNYHLPEYPFLYLQMYDDLPNLMGLYEIIEDDYCRSHAINSYLGLLDAKIKADNFIAFRESSSWDMYLTNTSNNDDGYKSLYIKIGESFRFITRFQPYDLKYWYPLFNSKTKAIRLSPNIIKVIEDNKELHKKMVEGKN